MKVFTTSERNSNFGVDLSLSGSILSITVRKAIAAKTPEGDDMPLADDQVLHDTRGSWLVLDEVEHQEDIDLSVLKNMPDFHDHAAFLYYLPVGLRKEFVNPGHTQPANLYALTQGTKLSGPQHGNLISLMHPLLNILVPFKNSPLSDWSVGVNTYAHDLVTVHGELEIEECLGLDVVRNTHLPKVWFNQKTATCAKDGTITVDFYIGDFDEAAIQGDAEVYLDVTGGSLNKYRCQTVNGVGSVTFRALDLEAGDVVKIKCGFKYFTGTDDCIVTVV